MNKVAPDGDDYTYAHPNVGDLSDEELELLYEYLRMLLGYLPKHDSGPARITESMMTLCFRAVQQLRRLTGE